MSYDYDSDANRSSFFAQYDEPDPDPEEDTEADLEEVRCPHHGMSAIIDYDEESNLLVLTCGCLL